MKNISKFKISLQIFIPGNIPPGHIKRNEAMGLSLGYYKTVSCGPRGAWSTDPQDPPVNLSEADINLQIITAAGSYLNPG